MTAARNRRAGVLVAVPSRGNQDLDALAAEVRRASHFEMIVFLDRAAGDCDPPQEVEAILTGVSGYSSIRNVILETAIMRRYSWVVFFDDDQLPCGPEWGNELAQTGLAEGADVIFGPVISAPTSSPWMTEQDGRSRGLLDVPSGRYDGDVYSGNTLLSVEFVQRTGLRFDPRFDRSGGEDTDFFRRAREAGAIIYLAQGARAIETQDPARFLPAARFRAGWQSRRRKHLLGQTIPHELMSRFAALARAVRWALAGAVTGSRPAIGRASFWLGAGVAWRDLK